MSTFEVSEELEARGLDELASKVWKLEKKIALQEELI